MSIRGDWNSDYRENKHICGLFHSLFPYGYMYLVEMHQYPLYIRVISADTDSDSEFNTSNLNVINSCNDC